MGRPPTYRNIEVRGTVYADAKAVADAYGVTTETVRKAIKKGTLHRIGTGAVGAEPLPVRIRGRVFPTARDAARHFGVGRSAIYHAIKQGREDRLGLPRQQKNGMAKPITIGPLSFPSMNEAGRVLGFGNNYVSQAISSGRTSAMERILSAAMREARRRQMQARMEGPDD